MEKKKNYIIASIIVLSLVGSLTPIIVGIVTANPPISITITEDPHYEVNEQGDLTISFSGTMTGVSSSESDFSLKVPESFEIPRQTDGSPVLEMLNNGSPSALSLLSDSFITTFALITHNSTLLPYDYVFEVNTTTTQYTTTIVPEWPSQANLAGGGASVTYYDEPYITSFYAYNSYKSNTEHVKTYVYNPSDYDWYNVQGVRYRIDSSTYTDFNDWTQTYSESSGWIQAHRTYVVHDYLSPTYHSYSGVSRYALNTGSFQVPEVYAYGSRLGGGSWSDRDYPSDQFVVSVESGTHPVFVLHLVDQNFRDSYHDEDSWFNDLEGKNFRMYDYWFGRYTDLETEFGINLESLVLSWSPGTADLYELFNNKIRQNAGSLIGKSGSWTSTRGTHSSNHGFDMLFGHVYLKNTYSGSDEDYKGAGLAGKNFAVLMKETAAGWIIDQQLGTMHEMLHTYKCQHITAVWYIMHKSWSTWTMHSDTESTIDSNINQYDGLS